MKKLSRYLILFIGVLLLLVILLVGACLIFEDSLLEKAKTKLAKNLGTEITTQNLDLDPFRNFPYFTLALDGLEIKGNQNQQFVEAENMEILINPISVIKEDIDLKAFIIQEGSLYLTKDKSNWNFDFSNESTTADSEPIAIQLEDVRLSNIVCKIVDSSSELSTTFKIENFSGGLDLGKTNSLSGVLLIIPETLKKGSYLATAKEPLDLIINISSDLKETIIKQLEIELEGNTLELDGSITSEVDIKGNIDVNTIESLKPWVPVSYHDYLLADSDWDFELNGDIGDPNAKIKVNSQELKVDVKKDNSDFQIDGIVKASIINKFQDDFNITRGDLLFSKMKVDGEEIGLNSMTGVMNVRDLELDYSGKNIKLFSDQIELENGIIGIEKLGIEVGDSDMEFSGDVEISDSTYVATGSIKANKIIAEDFLSMMQDSTESNSKMEGNFDISIKSLSNNDWKGEDIEGKMDYKEEILNYEVDLESFEGEITSKGSFRSENGIQFTSEASFSTLEIEEILDQLQNLGQEMITSENLSGSLSGHAMMDFYFDNEMGMDNTRSNALVAVKAEKGRLEDFKLLEDFSKYIDIKDLQDVRFDNMTNFFEWKGDHLVIPIIYIKNNAANFLISGYQNIENEILYHMQINASEVLANKFGKKKRRAKKNGWWNMYYIVEGNVEDFEVNSDKDRVKAGLNKSLIEKEEIFDKLVSKFGYSPVLKSIEEWEDL